MEILFESGVSKKPKVSFILLDWSCRESFHMLHYLNQQNVPRESYEIIWIEYYNRRSPEIHKRLEDCARQSKPPILDQWIVMDMPETLYYHKHLMYNIGVVLGKGEIICICDSDAMVRPTFVETVIKSFEDDPNIALHMDEVRNNDQRFHPFNYPSFEEVEGEGAINFKNGTTTGLVDTEDPLHTLNYGACFFARRDDLIAIGGSDEHLDFLGHVCGPYELTFRLKNIGRREIWHPTELLYHVWHPGQAGDGNYVGPHDGMHISSTALKAKESGRVQPLLENKAIKALRENPDLDPKSLIPQLIDPSCFEKWTYEAMSQSSSFYVWETAELVESIFHYNVVKHMGQFYGLPQALGAVDLNKKEEREHPDILVANSQKKIKKMIERNFLHREGGPASYEDQGRSSFGAQIFDQIRRLGTLLKPDAPGSSPQPALMNSHRGYNLVAYGEHLYGIPHSLGKVDLSEQNVNTLREEILLASSEEAAKSLIDQLLDMPEGQVIEEYSGFNIIKWGELIYGVPQFFGPVDQKIAESEEGSLFPKAGALEHLRRLIDQFNQPASPNVEREAIPVEQLDHPSVLAGASLEELNEIIDDQTGRTASPVFLEERKEYNIVKFKNLFWGIPQTLGEVDLMQERNLSHPSILSADVLEDLIRKIDEAASMSAGPVLMEGLDDFNIIKYKNRFWGIPHSLGEVDLMDEKNLENPAILSADSLDEVKSRMDEVVGMTAAPELVEEWNHHNIMKYKNRFWGIPHALGDFDVTREDTWSDPSILSADSLEEVKSRIDESVGLTTAPELAEEWNNHNIMKFKNRFWGIPHALGSLDLTKKKARKNPSVVSADFLEDVKIRIDESVGLSAAPELVEEWNNHNIMKYKNRFWGVPHVLGEFDLTTDENWNHPFIVSADSLQHAKDRVDHSVGLASPPEFLEEMSGHNILKYRNRYWGIPHSLGAVDITKEKNLEDSSILHADSLDEVKSEIDEAVGLTSAPELLEEWNNHNIMKYQNRFWGVPHAIGAVDLAQDESRKNPSLLSADSLDGVKKAIDESAATASPPEFLEEFQKYNIVKYNNRFLGIPIALGEIDPAKAEHRSHPSILTAETHEEVKSQIGTVAGWSAPPEFMEARSGYNLVRYRNRFYGIPQTLGEVKLSRK